jgi:hypothetical protein
VMPGVIAEMLIFDRVPEVDRSGKSKCHSR